MIRACPPPVAGDQRFRSGRIPPGADARGPGPEGSAGPGLPGRVGPGLPGGTEPRATGTHQAPGRRGTPSHQAAGKPRPRPPEGGLFGRMAG
ncbi:hypothetical protein C5L38_24430 [Streptomyces sp. WAC00288]|nr:hypothetical protein C5L38_24430 [Streptomyces sp. WAC00288]